MREYHIDTHPQFINHVKEKEMGGDLSVRFPEGSIPLLFIVQDESVYKKYQVSSRGWDGPGGKTKLLPKSDGCNKMVSCYVGRSFGMGIHLDTCQLQKINNKRKSSRKYISIDSAINVYTKNKKPELTDTHSLIRYLT